MTAATHDFKSTPLSMRSPTLIYLPFVSCAHSDIAMVFADGEKGWSCTGVKGNARPAGLLERFQMLAVVGQLCCEWFAAAMATSLNGCATT
jgi:hypothetical protein